MPALYARGREALGGNARGRALSFRATAMRNSFYMLGKALVLTLHGPQGALQPRGVRALQVAGETTFRLSTIKNRKQEHIFFNVKFQ